MKNHDNKQQPKQPSGDEEASNGQPNGRQRRTKKKTTRTRSKDLKIRVSGVRRKPMDVDKMVLAIFSLAEKLEADKKLEDDPDQPSRPRDTERDEDDRAA